MLNFFKKKTSPNESSDFQSSFTKEQKATIIGSLIMIAKVDGEANSKEIDYLQQSINLLQIDVDDDIFIQINSKHIDNMYRILNTLNYSQKEWLAVSIHGMILCDGDMKMEEKQHTLRLFENIGVTESEYIVIINKSIAILDRLN